MLEIEELAGIAGKKLNDVHLTKCLDEELALKLVIKAYYFGPTRVQLNCY